MLKRQLRLQSGKNFDQVNKVCFIGDYLPRKCGIATFTHDLRNAYADTNPHIKAVVCAVNDTKDGYAYSSDVVFEMDQDDEVSYMRAADYINSSGVDVVCLQHEYGIYGGPCGVMILMLLKSLRVPIVTTLHTILTEPSHDERLVLNSILSISTRVITMAQKGKEILTNVYNAPEHKLRLIPHGIPEMEFADTNKYKELLGFSGRKVVLTFGLLSPNKGIEFAVKGMAEVVKKCPDALYVCLGQTHPHLIREHGESYRNSLEWLCKEHGIGDHVKFVNRFVDLELLKQYIAACDVYLTPYLHEAQITSGTLSYSFGMGTAVVSTPYWHAAELLADGRGVLVPFRNEAAIATAVSDLLLDDERRQTMKRNAFDFGRTMTWSRSAEAYNEAFDEALVEHVQAPVVVMSAPAETVLPDVKLDHFLRMTDDVGMLQFATFDVPSRHSAYAVDVNARALILMALLKTAGFNWNSDLERRAATFSSFIDFAFDRSSGKFRDMLSFQRTWGVDAASQDTHARALWSIGTCARLGLHTEWASDLFRVATSNALNDLTHPRSIAYGILGYDAYLTRFPNDGERLPIFRSLAERLAEAYEKNSERSDDMWWLWYEQHLSYDNAMLPYAMLVAGQRLSEARFTQIGIDSLSWLMGEQLVHDQFRPIGNAQAWRKGEEKPLYDQMPIETCAAVLACGQAALSGDTSQDWSEVAAVAFNWFMGGNALGQSLYDSSTGGCYDGLCRNRVNKNQGADALLAFHLALVTLKRLKVGTSSADTPQLFTAKLSSIQ